MGALFIRYILMVTVSIGFSGATFIRLNAGGGSFEENDENNDDSGPPFIGHVRDKSGNPNADAKVSVAIASLYSSLFMRADDLGHVIVREFHKDIDADNIEISCSMDGYKPFAISM